MAQKKQPQRQKHIPQRTCVVCREKYDKRRLTRIVKTAEGVVVDLSGKKNGRGAYVCDQLPCWERLLKQGQLLKRALKSNITDSELNALAEHKPATVERQ